MGTEVIPKTEEALPADPPSDLEQQIIRQIEYYFGNFNLSRDKFMRQKLSEDNGWVTLELLLTFNRLKKLTEDVDVICTALKKSPKQLLEFSEDSTKIRRRDPTTIPADFEQMKDELSKRTLYVKGFKKTNTLDELLDFFKEYNVENIMMRKNFQLPNKPFKGSVFASFDTVADAQSFLEKKNIKFSGTELLKEWKADYLKRKNELYETIKAEREKKMLKRTQLSKEAKENGDKQKIQPSDHYRIPGSLLKLAIADKNTLREHIKEAFEPYDVNVVYVDYSKGLPTAVVRFDSGVAASVFEKLNEEDGERKLEINSFKAVVSLIEGDDETEYWKSIDESRKETFLKLKEAKGKQFKNKKGGRFKSWGRQRNQNQKRRNDDDDDDKEEEAENSRKKAKTDDSEEVKDETPSVETISETPEEKNEPVETES